MDTEKIKERNEHYRKTTIVLQHEKYQKHVVKKGVRAIHAKHGKVLCTDLRNFGARLNENPNDKKSIVKAVTIHDEKGKCLGSEYFNHLEEYRWKCAPDENELNEYNDNYSIEDFFDLIPVE